MNEDDTFVNNAADEEQVRKARIEEEALLKKEMNDLRSLLAKPSFRRFIWRYLVQCHMFNTSFVAGEYDRTAFREGERNIGLRLMSDITQASPESYLLMLKERESRRHESKQEKEQ